MRVEITEANIEKTASKLGYLRKQSVFDELLAEGALPEVAYFLVVAAQVYLKTRNSDQAEVDRSFASE